MRVIQRFQKHRPLDYGFSCQRRLNIAMMYRCNNDDVLQFGLLFYPSVFYEEHITTHIYNALISSNKGKCTI